MTKYYIGDKIKVRPNIEMLGILQLSEHAIYEVLNVGRAQNPDNDHLYIRNDHGRVVPYLARLFNVAPVSQLMANIAADGTVLQIIIAYPYVRTTNPEDFDAMWGKCIYDATGFNTIGKAHDGFSRSIFRPIEFVID